MRPLLLCAALFLIVAGGCAGTQAPTTVTVTETVTERPPSGPDVDYQAPSLAGGKNACSTDGPGPSAPVLPDFRNASAAMSKLAVAVGGSPGPLVWGENGWANMTTGQGNVVALVRDGIVQQMWYAPTAPSAAAPATILRSAVDALGGSTAFVGGDATYAEAHQAFGSHELHVGTLSRWTQDDGRHEQVAIGPLRDLSGVTLADDAAIRQEASRAALCTLRAAGQAHLAPQAGPMEAQSPARLDARGDGLVFVHYLTLIPIKCGAGSTAGGSMLVEVDAVEARTTNVHFAPPYCPSPP